MYVIFSGQNFSYFDLILSPETCLRRICSSDVSRRSVVFLKIETLTLKSLRQSHRFCWSRFHCYYFSYYSVPPSANPDCEREIVEGDPR